MKLVAAVVTFLLLSWTPVSSLRPSGATQPGILLRLSDKGLQYAAKKIMEFVDSKIDPGMRLSDLKGTFQPSVGSVDYLMTDIRAWNFNWNDVSGGVIPGVGVRVVFRKISVKIDGRFHINYSVMALPSTNRGTFSLTVSDVSLSVNATAGMGATGLPTLDLSNCLAEIGNIGLDFKAESLNWVLSYFTENIKNALKPALTSAICKAVASARDLVVPQITNHIKSCLDRSCFFLIDLHFVSPPVFGKGFVETAFQGEIFWRSDPKRAPFKAVQFQRLPVPVSPKMADIYVNAYVLNTLMYALYQNDLLSCVFTKNELPVDYRYVMSTSCASGFCIGKVLPDVVSLYPDSTVELDIVATKLPSLDIYDNDLFSLTFGGNISVRVRNATGSVKSFGVIALEGFVTASALLTSDGAFVFIVKQIGVSNASISEVEAQGSKDMTEVLRSSATNYLLPKLNEFAQKGFSVLRVGKLSASSPSLKLIQNAFVLMTDVIYSNVTVARLLRMTSD